VHHDDGRGLALLPVDVRDLHPRRYAQSLGHRRRRLRHQNCLGAVYGWSVFVQPLVRTTVWTLTQVSLTFTLAVAFLGVGTIAGGLWQDRVGCDPTRTDPASG
jgi:hypothetical protein